MNQTPKQGNKWYHIPTLRGLRLEDLEDGKHLTNAFLLGEDTYPRKPVAIEGPGSGGTFTITLDKKYFNPHIPPEELKELLEAFYPTK